MSIRSKDIWDMILSSEEFKDRKSMVYMGLEGHSASSFPYWLSDDFYVPRQDRLDEIIKFDHNLYQEKVEDIESMSTELIRVYKNRIFTGFTKIPKCDNYMKRIIDESGYIQDNQECDCNIFNLFGYNERWVEKVDDIELFFNYYMALQESYKSLMNINIWATKTYAKAFIIKEQPYKDFEFKCFISFSKRRMK